MSKGFKMDIKGMKGFEESIRKEVKKQALNASYDFECPECNTKFQVKVGKNICPKCGITINLKPDSSWDKI